MSGPSRQRCQRCRRIQRRCVCAYLCDPPLEHDVKITLIQSQAERDHVKNSGALLAGSLVKSEVIEIKLPSHHTSDQAQREFEEERLQKALAHLEQAPHVILYPDPSTSAQHSSQDAHPLAHVSDQSGWSALAQASRPQITLLDLTWGHSERILRSVPHLYSAPRVALSEAMLHAMNKLGLRAYQRLRTVNTQVDHRYSTLEAGVAALASYDHILDLTMSLERALARYHPLWDRYLRWVDDESQRFQRSRS